MDQKMSEIGSLAPAWDDEKFIERCEELARAKNWTLPDLAENASMARDYFAKRGGGRARNIVSIIRLAGALGVPVVELIEGSANPPAPPPPPPIDPIKLERLATVANVAAHLYLALDGRKATVPEDIDAQELLQVLMRFIEPRNRPNNQ